MLHPSITDYTDALENPAGLFRTLGGMDGVRVDRDIYGEAALRSGNSAAIFTYRDGAGMSEGPEVARRFLKCYIRPNPHLRTVYEYVERVRPPLLPCVRLLRDELYIHSLSGEAGWVDVVEGEWVSGETLDTEVARAVRDGDKERLRQLANAFDELCRELLASEWAHGDLKPENIVVHANDGDTTAVRMTLVDCDAMWIPALAGQRAAEAGTPAYRHPARTAALFDKRVDDYPALLLSASLHALALAPELYAQYNTPDILLLSPVEVLGGTSAAHADILALFAREGCAREYRMTEALTLPYPDELHAERFFATAREGVAKTAGTDGMCMTLVAGTRLETFVEWGKWGFADEAGRTVVEPFWDEVLEFRGGKAKARLAEEWHELYLYDSD